MSEMPSIVELLERLARLEADNERLRADNAALRAENDQFKRRLGLTSRNSNKPPSSDGPVKVPRKSRRESSGRLPGKQPALVKIARKMIPGIGLGFFIADGACLVAPDAARMEMPASLK